MNYEAFYSTICSVMQEFYSCHKDKTFCILLSGGYDSRFVLYMCKDLGIPISKCYTFSLENHLSTDAKLAIEVCKVENVPLQIVSLPIDAMSVVGAMEILARDYACVKKTDFECVYPLYYLYQAIDEDIILMGTHSDDYFGLGKKYAIHFSRLRDGLTKYKEHMRENPNNDQVIQKALLDKKYRKIMFDPFNTSQVYKVFENTTWDEVNKPYKKGPIYVKFKDRYDAIKPYRSSYQCGDSGIRELCKSVLLMSKYNTQHYKSVTGCYNELVRRYSNDTNKSKLF